MPHGGTDTEIRDAAENDLPALLGIYNRVVKTSHATFDLAPRTMVQGKKWMAEHRGKYPVIVAEAEGRVIGYASISKFRDRPAYSKTAESSVYVCREFRGRGTGFLLMEEIVERAKKLGYHSVVAGIALPNEVSVMLHEGLGFELVGIFREVGLKFGHWRDVAFYQLLL